jgi:uridine kinase
MRSFITISGCSGAGKTALTDALAQTLDNMLVIKFDEIDALQDWEGKYADWLARGADYEEFKLDRMKTHVAALINAAPTRYVIFDYPYGRRHSAFCDLIDLAVFVDTPLDVAMARRLLRDLPDDPAAMHNWIKAELQGYLVRARTVYLHYVGQMKNGCDLVVDGTRPLDALVAEVLAAVMSKRRGIQP